MEPHLNEQWSAASYKVFKELLKAPNRPLRLTGEPSHDAVAKIINLIHDHAHMRWMDYTVNTKRHVNSIWLVLDAGFCIAETNMVARKTFHLKNRTLQNKPFVLMLNNNSRMRWYRSIQPQLAQGSAVLRKVLHFHRPGNRAVPALCFISPVLLHRKICISATVFTPREYRCIQQLMQSGLLDRFSTTGLQTLSLWFDPEQEGIREVARYIEEHLEDPWPTIKKLAALSNMNREKLRELFKRYYKMTIYKFYTEKRMEKAKCLLLHTDKPVKNIAFSLGYRDPSTFYRNFKSYFGCSPAAMRSSKQP